MSKERLETSYVIETVKRETVIAKGINNTRDNVNLPIDLVLALIEQAERVQELEKRLKIYQKRSWFEDYEKVAKQNKRYREALEFYASKENYKPINGIFFPSYQNKVDEDGGKKARQALKGE